MTTTTHLLAAVYASWVEAYSQWAALYVEEEAAEGVSPLLALYAAEEDELYAALAELEAAAEDRTDVGDLAGLTVAELAELAARYRSLAN